MKARIAPLIALAILLTGCVTTNPTPNVLAHYRSEAKIATYLTAALYLEKHPEAKPIFEKVRDGVAGFAAAGNFDPVMLAAYLRENLPFKEIKSERAGIFLMTGVMIFQEATGNITIETPPIVKAFMDGIQDGLSMALASQTDC